MKEVYLADLINGKTLIFRIGGADIYSDRGIAGVTGLAIEDAQVLLTQHVENTINYKLFPYRIGVANHTPCVLNQQGVVSISELDQADPIYNMYMGVVTGIDLTNNKASPHLQ